MEVQVDVLLVKAREHKLIYHENMEDIRACYVKAALEKRNISTKVLDFAFVKHNPENDAQCLLESIKILKPKMLIFFIDKHPTNSPHYTIELADYLVKNYKENLTHISFYGNTHVNIEMFFRHYADTVILGEEEAVCELAVAVLNNESFDCIDGIAYKLGEETVVRLAEVQDDLDKLPNPSRYALQEIKDKEKKFYCANILASRGCFGKCQFCYLRTKEKYYANYGRRERSIKSIVEEIKQLYNMGIVHIYFSDEEFLAYGDQGVKRAQEFAKEIKKEKIKIQFSIYLRADCINEDVVAILSDVGLYCVFLGVESFSQEVLNRYGKGISVQQNIEAIKILTEHNIHVRLGVIMFDMYTTLNELLITIKTIKEIVNSHPRLIFQSLFFSNALIPLNNSPLESTLDLKGKSSVGYYNETMNRNYHQRSDNEQLDYFFVDETVSKIYTCVAQMAKLILAHCIEDENEFYENGFNQHIFDRFNYITQFSIEMVDNIYQNIINGLSVEKCIKEIENEVNKYYSD